MPESKSWALGATGLCDSTALAYYLHGHHNQSISLPSWWYCLVCD